MNGNINNLYGIITAYEVRATNFTAIPGTATINNLNYLTVDDYISNSSDVPTLSSYIIFGGTGTTTITNSFLFIAAKSSGQRIWCVSEGV